MKCENYTIRMNLTQGEITMLLTAVNGYKGVVASHSKGILNDIESLIKFQIVKQDRDFIKKRLEEKKKSAQNT